MSGAGVEANGKGRNRGSRDGGRGRGRGRGRRRDRGGGGRQVKISKALAWLLRHGAPKVGLAVDGRGYALLSEVLATDRLAKLGATVEEVLAEVDSNAKQRFKVETRDGELYIRANQGHSFALAGMEEDMEPITEANVDAFPIVVHGTYHKSLDAILSSGLSKMTRTHVHMAQGLPGEAGVISGMRGSAQVLIYVDVAAAIAAGIPFFVSDNGVVLSPGNADGMIPAAYFAQVVDARSGDDLLAGVS